MVCIILKGFRTQSTNSNHYTKGFDLNSKMTRFLSIFLFDFTRLFCYLDVLGDYFKRVHIIYKQISLNQLNLRGGTKINQFMDDRIMDKKYNVAWIKINLVLIQ